MIGSGKNITLIKETGPEGGCCEISLVNEVGRCRETRFGCQNFNINSNWQLVGPTRR